MYLSYIRLMKNLFIVVLALFSSFTFSQELKINLAAAKITFVADMQNTSGSVSGLDASINFDMNDLSKSSITGTVDVSKLETGNQKRDEHLKSADFFDAAKYPTMSFKSQSITKQKDVYVMKGLMTIKHIEREETITFSFANNMFTGEGIIQAANYDLGSFAKKKPEKTNVKISFVIPVL